MVNNGVNLHKTLVSWALCADSQRMPFLLFLIILLVYNDPSFCRSVDDVPENRLVQKIGTENPTTRTGTHGIKCTKCIVGAKRRHKSSNVLLKRSTAKFCLQLTLSLYTFELLLWREYICSECAKDKSDKPFTCGSCKEGTSAQPFICRRCTNSNPDINSSSDYSDYTNPCAGLITTTMASLFTTGFNNNPEEEFRRTSIGQFGGSKFGCAQAIHGC